MKLFGEFLKRGAAALAYVAERLRGSSVKGSQPAAKPPIGDNWVIILDSSSEKGSQPPAATDGDGSTGA